MKDIIMIGAGGHAKVVADIILQRKKKLKEKINLIGFLDDAYKNLKYKEIFGVPILGDLSKIKDFEEKNYEYLIAIGNNSIREKIAKKYNKLKYYIAIHPDSIIGMDVKIKDGTVIMANAVINSGSKIGEHVILNTSSVIEHDCIVNNYCHISPNATLCGAIKVGSKTWVGANSVVKQEMKIGENVTVGAGSVVIRNIGDNCIAVGNPAKKIKDKG
ncbi:acetyltransferase [Fusobacterium sp. MFO224]|uniref:acetyltransferase n=1 Tax=Fusobacterium sp. MFO224 TaxID=3378070 RepID=UPI0038540A80